MLTKRLPVALAAAACLASGAAFGNTSVGKRAKPSVKLICDRLIDDFSGSRVGAFPRGWRTRDEDEMPEARAKRMYVVERERQRKVLHARYRDTAITIGRLVRDWDLRRYPVLSWEWKATELPRGGDERESSRNDSAAAVYAIWDIGFPFYVNGIKYAWSSTLDVGRHISKRLGHDHVLVEQSGSARLDQWQKVYVNVRDHRKRFFGRDAASPPDGIALLTDADATESGAEAYYANFRLCRQVYRLPDESGRPGAAQR